MEHLKAKTEKNQPDKAKAEHEKSAKVAPLQRSRKKLGWKWLQKKNVRYFLAAVILLVVVLPVGLYFYSPLGKLTYRIFRYLPYPVAVVDSQDLVTTKEMIAGAQAVQTFYQSQDFSEVGMRVDFGTEQGKMRLKIKEKDVLDKLVENRIVQHLAKQRGLLVTEQEAQRDINQKINQAGDPQALEMNLKKLYNWSLEDFRGKVVIPQLYLQKLSAYYFAKNQQDQPGYQKIQQAQEKLAAKGKNFAEVAKEFSEGPSAANGGELGWFRQEQLVPEVAKVAFELKPESVSPIIQSSLGYHIVRVEEAREVEVDENQSPADPVSIQDGKVKEVRLSQIFVSEGGFLDWLKGQKKKVPVQILMKEYQWDENEARVKFRNESLNGLEQELKFKAEGDPSMQ